MRGTRNLTDDTDNTVEELMEAIVDRYLKTDCAIFTPNPDRLNHIEEMVETYKADGVIHYGLQFCQPYLMEAMPVEKALEAKNIPMRQARKLLEGVEYDHIMATGYGRHLFELSFETPTVTEIKTYAVGANALFPDVRTILDIGGQDSKAIAL